MQRAFGRALRRAKLPVKFSEGFNPHIVMSFASPLSVGIGTEGDYLEVRFEKDCAGEEIINRMNAVLPKDIRILSAGRLEEGAPKLMAQNHSAEYELVFEGDMEAAAQKFLKAESFLTHDRKGKEIDIRPLVLDLAAKKNVLKARLENSSRAALNPAVLAGALGGGAAITRTECFYLKDGRALPMDSLERE
jgi:radical SAM-linked protein